MNPLTKLRKDPRLRLARRRSEATLEDWLSGVVAGVCLGFVVGVIATLWYFTVLGVTCSC